MEASGVVVVPIVDTEKYIFLVVHLSKIKDLTHTEKLSLATFSHRWGRGIHISIAIWCKRPNFRN